MRIENLPIRYQVQPYQLGTTRSGARSGCIGLGNDAEVHPMTWPMACENRTGSEHSGFFRRQVVF